VTQTSAAYFQRAKGMVAVGSLAGLPDPLQRLHTIATARPSSVFVKFDMSVSIIPGATAYRVRCNIHPSIKMAVTVK
jgi:hypothetical protein